MELDGILATDEIRLAAAPHSGGSLTHTDA